MPKQATINIDPETLKPIICSCGGQHFTNVLVLKVLPALYSQSGKESIMQFPMFKCDHCGMVRSPAAIMQAVNTGGLVQ